MEILERIGASWQMKKLMLTVQIENAKAINFYRSLNTLRSRISTSESLRRVPPIRHPAHELLKLVETENAGGITLSS
ncbi:hypothetical protein PGTUg99_035409 [Puccinia graminis f. sp. tritici]|uniref:Uncharacterized protein n=1 Tax=Puccinia graminis f. sp. tritici TaxID=56615 RepID=A0A5B0SLA6_PUCGR|nr:hypothetical protein PGTUg99_035409 [Puccinia graminis f. sp. tritici]